jgi:DNA-binding MarR family transcriptional regulator
MADQRPIGYWLALVGGLVDEQFAGTLEEHGVTRSEWRLLNVLAQAPAPIERLDAALAPYLQPDEGASAVELLGELIESAWINATPDAYELTDRGRGAVEHLGAKLAEQRATLAEGVSDADRDTTCAALERMAHNLGWNG